MSKQIDNNFLNVGQKPGLCIWRIEKFNLKKLNPNEHGKFYSGDSYLLLSSKGENNQVVGWDIHFWLGVNSTVDEYATAAIKAVELDDALGGTPVQYREVQNYESKLFLSYFEKRGLTYMDGGIESALNQIGNIKVEPKLFMVKGKKNVRIVQVPIRFSSLNKSDVFILDNNTEIYVWKPSGSSVMERLKSDNFAKNIRDHEHSGRAEVISLEEDELKPNSPFHHILVSHDPLGNLSQIVNISDVQDTDFEKGFLSAEAKLYRVSDNNVSSQVEIMLEASGKLKREMLDSNDCFIIDVQNKGIYSWIGKRCTQKEKIAAVQGVKNLIKFNNYPNYIPLQNVIENGETTTFKSIFVDWN